STAFPSTSASVPIEISQRLGKSRKIILEFSHKNYTTNLQPFLYKYEPSQFAQAIFSTTQQLSVILHF
ncbi:16201_t:CDS:1, partial [Gigaspora rosea]